MTDSAQIAAARLLVELMRADGEKPPQWAVDLSEEQSGAEPAQDSDEASKSDNGEPSATLARFFDTVARSAGIQSQAPPSDLIAKAYYSAIHESTSMGRQIAKSARTGMLHGFETSRRQAIRHPGDVDVFVPSGAGHSIIRILELSGVEVEKPGTDFTKAVKLRGRIETEVVESGAAFSKPARARTPLGTSPDSSTDDDL